MIQLLNSNEINKGKWDACINNSDNPLFYFLFEVIDIASDFKWEALIEDDYKNVFPLPYKIKFGIKYYYTPFWIQRLGWINTQPESFNLNLLSKVSYIDLFVQNINNTDLESRENYVLDLTLPFQFSSNTIRNLKKATAQSFTIIENNLNANSFVTFFKNNKGAELSNINNEAYLRLEKIIEYLKKENLISEYTCQHNNQILVRGIFVNYQNTCTYFKGCGTSEASNTGAGHFFIDFAIKKAHHRKCAKFDFYGGSNSGMARFYSGFGAQAQAYKHLLKNNLPKVLRWLKKN